jgi:drug/metabolite transporter (DMT)-like permease
MLGGLTANARGIVAMCLAQATFALNDMFVKLATSDLSVPQVLFWRGVFVIASLAVALVALGELRGLRRAMEPRVVLRASIEVTVAISFISALAHMPIGDITALFMTLPLLITASAAILLKESVGWRRWSAIAVGFAGAILIVRPTAASVDIWVWVALFSVAGAAVRDLMTRGIDPAISSLVVSCATAVAVFVTGGVLTVLGGASLAPPGTTTLLWLAAAGVFVAIGNYFVIVAFRGGDVSVISPFRYTVILWALMTGYGVWGDVPDRLAILGTLLIVGAGLYTIHRERVRAREAALKSAG